MLMSKYMLAQSESMGQYRAVMTATDRERITGKADVPDSKRYEAASRIRKRIEELEGDAEILKEHHPGLYEELQDAVCGEVADGA